jgi:hypothetical protein
MGERLKVYCETSFWSWLVSRPSSDPDHTVKQAYTRNACPKILTPEKALEVLYV